MEGMTRLPRILAAAVAAATLFCQCSCQGLGGDVPPGLRHWLGRDNCGAPRWQAFHGELAAVSQALAASQFAPALAQLATVVTTVTTDPHVAFDCSTAVASALVLAAQCCEQLRLPVLSARLRQLSAIFGSFDYQMKGEDYIDRSVWPMQWQDNMEGILRSVYFLKQQERTREPWRGNSARAAIGSLQRKKGGARASFAPLQIAVVSVCDYDAGVTPLARLSLLNKDAYSSRHGYEPIMYQQSPAFQDPLSSLLTEPLSHRPPAWSKVDGILDGLASGRYDWVYWMDCDSFFMDAEVRLEELIALASAEAGCDDQVDDRGELRDLVQKWMAGPGQNLAWDELVQWYDMLLDDSAAPPRTCPGSAAPETALGPVPLNSTLGWGSWLYEEGRPHLIASEDGLMLNTGNVLVRASTWAWRFFQKVRGMTFGLSPVTQHPWWEQTAMVYLLQLPFTLAHAARQQPRSLEDLGTEPQARRGYAPACFMLSQKQLNGYPPAVASSLVTHERYEPGDFIVSFSGCKVYTSQEVCNQLFLSYFFQVHDVAVAEKDPALRFWL